MKVPQEPFIPDPKSSNFVYQVTQVLRKIAISLNLLVDGVFDSNIKAKGSILSSGTSGIGYTTGAGGTITQLTNKSTPVTLNTPTGQITMNNASLAANTNVSFTFNNSIIGANDIVNVQVNWGANLGAYQVWVGSIGAGACNIIIRNTTTGALSDAVVIQYAIIKGATS